MGAGSVAHVAAQRLQGGDVREGTGAQCVLGTSLRRECLVVAESVAAVTVHVIFGSHLHVHVVAVAQGKVFRGLCLGSHTIGASVNLVFRPIAVAQKAAHVDALLAGVGDQSIWAVDAVLVLVNGVGQLGGETEIHIVHP